MHPVLSSENASLGSVSLKEMYLKYLCTEICSLHSFRPFVKESIQTLVGYTSVSFKTENNRTGILQIKLKGSSNPVFSLHRRSARHLFYFRFKSFLSRLTVCLPCSFD
jgi:hypothetical protein